MENIFRQFNFLVTKIIANPKGTIIQIEMRVLFLVFVHNGLATGRSKDFLGLKQEYTLKKNIII